jgi:phage-related protein
MPQDVKDVFGFALFQAEKGEKHRQAELMKGYKGALVYEVREVFKGDAYRLVYAVSPTAIYALHAFKKKSKSGTATPQKDLDLIMHRLKEVKE